MTDSNAATPERTRRLQLRHRAVPGELRAIRVRVERWADQWGLSDDVLVDLQLALGEAVANGVEHAYPMGDPGTVDVELEMRCVGRAHRVVAVRVADHGRWRPAPQHPGYRGRGLMMIERLALHMDVQQSAHGTEVCFEIPVAA